jgi:hypothetical protein
LDIIIYCGIGAVALMLFAWWCGRKMGPDYVAVGGAVLPLPKNRLEELLIATADTAGSPELTEELKRAELIVPCNSDGDMAAMTFAFPPEFADGSDDCAINDDGQLEQGPLIFCFSSHAMADQANDDSGMSGLLFGRMFEMRQYPAREVFAFALSADLTVHLNAFGGTGHTFTRDDMLELTKAD